jgi:hypothetical protein
MGAGAVGQPRAGMSTLGQLTDEDFAATKAAKRMQMSAPDASAQRTIAELRARIEQLEKGRRIER